MKKIILLVALVNLMALVALGQTTDQRINKDKRIEEEFKRFNSYDADIVLRGDVAAMESFYPDDLVVTNQFNQFINKQKVLERVRENIIKYKSYEKKMEYLRVYGNTVVTAGTETVVPTVDANRPDAGQIVHRRFTEVWMKRKGQWRKIARHVSTTAPQ
jgi:ketosteroid isomerase-like protein